MRRLLFSLLVCLATACPAVAAPAWKKLADLPDPLGVAAPFAGVARQALIVAGGANFPNGMPWTSGKKVWSDRVFVLEKPDATWREAGKLPRALGYGVSITTPVGVFCIGGSDATRHYADCFLLKWDGAKVTTRPAPPLPRPLALATGALIGTTIHVAGGCEEPGEQAASAKAYTLDLSVPGAVWKELPPCPGAPRLLAQAAVFEGRFLYFGGCSLGPDASGKIVRTWLKDAWFFSQATGWMPLPPLPHPLAAAASPAPRLADGKFLVVAGDDGSRAGFSPPEQHPGFPAASLLFDPATKKWSAGPSVPAPRATLPLVTWGNLFVLPSGEVRPGVRSPEVWSLPKK